MLRGFLWAKGWAADAHDAGFAASLGRRLEQLMLMMLASRLFWAKGWAADAHDAGFAASFGRRAGQLMLMMHASRLPLGEGLGS